MKQKKLNVPASHANNHTVDSFIGTCQGSGVSILYETAFVNRPSTVHCTEIKECHVRTLHQWHWPSVASQAIISAAKFSSLCMLFGSRLTFPFPSLRQLCSTPIHD